MVLVVSETKVQLVLAVAAGEAVGGERAVVKEMKQVIESYGVVWCPLCAALVMLLLEVT